MVKNNQRKQLGEGKLSFCLICPQVQTNKRTITNKITLLLAILVDKIKRKLRFLHYKKPVTIVNFEFKNFFIVHEQMSRAKVNETIKIWF